MGITGRSGSGKSTFLRLLMRFWDVNTGTIRFGEEDIRRVNTATLRAQESLVTQETELFNDTIENNIRIAKKNAHPRRSGSGLQKGCTGRLYPQPAQGV